MAASAKDELGMLMSQAQETPTEKPAPKKFLITLDNTPSEVVKLDSEGHDLFFEDAPGKFLDLGDDVLQTLSAMTQSRYLVSYRANAKLRKKDEHPELFKTPGIEVSPRLASATSRITVKGKDPSKAYAWKRTDELQAASYEGWKVCQDPNIQSFGGDVGSSHRIAAGGETEMVLMEVPKATESAMLVRDADKSKRRIDGADKATIEDMVRSGGVPYVPRAGDKTNFT